MVTVTQITQMRQYRRARQNRNPTGKFAIGCSILISLVIAFASIYAAYTFSQVTQNLPSIEILPQLLEPPNGLLLQPTRLYDQSGEQVILTLQHPATLGRQYLHFASSTALSPDVPKQEILPSSLISATIAYTDPQFWEHPGFIWTDINQTRHSTLAQRLAARFLLADEPPSMRRALRERLLAAQITSRFGREKLLEWYLNNAPFGHLAFGADAAAKLYFQKPASQLSLAETALLAAVADEPSLNPIDAPQQAQTRQKQVVQRLLQEQLISPEEGIQAVQAELRFAPNSARGTHSWLKDTDAGIAPAFSLLALQQLTSELKPERIEMGGLKLITTLDLRLQKQVTCAVQTQLARLNAEPSKVATEKDFHCETARLLPTIPLKVTQPLPTLEVNVVVLDPQTGKILALVGEPSTEILRNHPAGSLVTPFIYLAGFTRGLAPASLVWDVPSQNEYASVENFDGQFRGPMRLRTALANDYLVPATQVLNQVGIENVWLTAQQLGIDSPAAEKPSGLDIFRPLNLLEVSQAFSILANQGIATGYLPKNFSGKPSTLGSQPFPIQPIALQRVLDATGQPWLDLNGSEARPIITPQLAYLLTHVLSDETARWVSLGHPNALEIGHPVATKISRTMRGDSIWVVGYTPQRVVVVWLGTTSSQEDLSGETSRLLQNAAAGLWHAITQYISRDLPYPSWAVPAGISQLEVCDPSGMLPTKACPNIVNEVFLAGNEPIQVDTMYHILQINRETGRLATVFTPPDLIEERSYISIPDEAKEWAQKAGLETPPEIYDVIPNVLPAWPEANITSPSLFAVVHGQVTIEGSASGENFVSYRIQVGKGLNPQSWFQIGEDISQPVTNGKLATWDTQGLSDLYAIQLVVLLADQNVKRTTTLVTVDNQPPTITVEYPVGGTEIVASTNEPVIFLTSVQDNLQIQSVLFYLDDHLLSTLTQPPYNISWSAIPGKHTLRVKAIDQANNISEVTVEFFVIG